MKFVIALALFAVVAAHPADKYDSKFDDINVDEIIDNIRLLEAYAECFIGTGKCTAQGKDIKELIPGGIQTGCGKCTDKQKPLVAKFIHATREKLPEKWNTLNGLHNGDGKYDKTLEDFLNKHYH